MKRITVYTQLTFLADQTTEGNPLDQTRQAVQQINGVLQRDPYGLGAEIILSKKINRIRVEDEDEGLSIKY